MVCNGGVAVEVAILYVLEGGVGEFSLDFTTHSMRSCLAAAILSALAGVNGDTWASELGTVLSKTEPRLITSFRKVPVGLYLLVDALIVLKLTVDVFNVTQPIDFPLVVLHSFLQI